jgi:methylated-DNA-[protein]-cysteine S-methyltransferase
MLNATFAGYFGGGRDAPTNVIDWHLLADDAAELLRSVQKIPYSEPLSYDRIMASMSAYDCGLIVSANPMPLLIPCHRVGRGSNRVEAYVGGLDRLRFIQEFESGPAS